MTNQTAFRLLTLICSGNARWQLRLDSATILRFD